jgi:hypothetical protein
MQNKSPERALRNVLFVDAATCVGCGLLMSLASAPVADLTALPAGLLTYAGISLLPIALFMVLVGARRTRSPTWVGAVIAGNALWTLASFGLLLSGMVAPNALGVAFVVAQALVVAVLTVLESRLAAATLPSPVLRTA